MNPGVNPWKAGLTGRCPRCGEATIFAGFLKLGDRCEACGLDLTQLNAADGPAFFAMSFVGIFVGFAALIVEVAYQPPVWAHALIWLPMILALSLALLRPIKGIMVALQYRHGAHDMHGRDDGA